MRFYIHSEEEPSFALPVQWDDADTRPVEALLQHFLAAYAATVDAGEPSLDSEEFLRGDGRPLRYRRLLCPLSSDGQTVDMLFGVLAGLPPAPRGQPE